MRACGICNEPATGLATVALGRQGEALVWTCDWCAKEYTAGRRTRRKKGGCRTPGSIYRFTTERGYLTGIDVELPKSAVRGDDQWGNRALENALHDAIADVLAPRFTPEPKP